MTDAKRIAKLEAQVEALRARLEARTTQLTLVLLQISDMKEQLKGPLPEGYEPHELPADYTGKLWIEGQLRQRLQGVLDAM